MKSFKQNGNRFKNTCLDSERGLRVGCTEGNCLPKHGVSCLKLSLPLEVHAYALRDTVGPVIPIEVGIVIGGIIYMVIDSFVVPVLVEDACGCQPFGAPGILEVCDQELICAIDSEFHNPISSCCSARCLPVDSSTHCVSRKPKWVKLLLNYSAVHVL